MHQLASLHLGKIRIKGEMAKTLHPRWEMRLTRKHDKNSPRKVRNRCLSRVSSAVYGQSDSSLGCLNPKRPQCLVKLGQLD
jgi:GTP1/Obg family GTP-binding protein